MGNTSSADVASNLSGNWKLRAGREDGGGGVENYFKDLRNVKYKYRIAQNNPTIQAKPDLKHWKPDDITPSMLSFLLPHKNVRARSSSDIIPVPIQKKRPYGSMSSDISCKLSEVLPREDLKSSSGLATIGRLPTGTDTSVALEASSRLMKNTFTVRRFILETLKAPPKITTLFSSKSNFDQGDANATLRKECEKLEYLWKPQVKSSEASTNLRDRLSKTNATKSDNRRDSKSKSKFTFSAAFKTFTKSEPKVIHGQETTCVYVSNVHGTGHGDLKRRDQNMVVVPAGFFPTVNGIPAAPTQGKLNYKRSSGGSSGSHRSSETQHGSLKSIHPLTRQFHQGSRSPVPIGNQRGLPGMSTNEHYPTAGDGYQNQQYPSPAPATVTPKYPPLPTGKRKPEKQTSEKRSPNNFANYSPVAMSTSENTPNSGSGNTFSNESAGSSEKKYPKRGAPKKKQPPPPPVYISSSYGSSTGSGSKSKTTADRLKNVDIVEELTYCAPGDPCAGCDCCSPCCDTYCCCNDCGECRLLPNPCECNPCCCPTSNPVKYCRRQRFNFDDESKKQGDDAPPYSRESLANPYDDIPCGKNPKHDDYKKPCKPRNPCEDVLPAESGTYFFDACRGTFIPVEEIKTDGNMPPEIIDEIIEEEPVLTNIEPIMQPIMNPCCGPCAPYGPCGGPCPCPPPMPFCGVVGPCKESEFRQDNGSLAMQGLCGANIPGLAAMGPYGAIAMPQYQYQSPPDPPEQPSNPYPPCMPIPPCCPCPPCQPQFYGPMYYPGYPGFPGCGKGKKKKKGKKKSKKRKSKTPEFEDKPEEEGGGGFPDSFIDESKNSMVSDGYDDIIAPGAIKRTSSD